MWIFSRKAPPYKILNKVFECNSLLSYSLYDCVRNSDQKNFSIFEVRSNSGDVGKALIQNLIKSFKKIVHPAIPNFIEHYENDGLDYIVTEKITPLKDEILSNTEIVWALYVISDFVFFLKNQKIIHGNIHPISLFMTPGHEPKIAGLEFITSKGEGPISKFYKNFIGVLQNSPLKCLQIPESYNESFANSIDLEFVRYYIFRWSYRLPNELGKYVSNWPDAYEDEFLKSFLEENYWNTDKYMHSILFLKQLPLKEQSEREIFFNDFLDSLSIFSFETQEKFILPILINALLFDQSVSILQIILNIGKCLDDETYDSIISPVLLPFFENKSRNIRIFLLQNIKLLIPKHYSEKIINEKIFPQIVNGFSDTSLSLKSTTIISMVSFSPFLNPFNKKILLRELQKLLNDRDESIRCNTVVCMVKISDTIDEEYRAKKLLSFFLIAIKDSSHITRKAALSGFKTCQKYFPKDVIATTIIPNISPLIIDNEIDNRKLAISTLQSMLEMFIGEYYIESSTIPNQLQNQTLLPDSTQGNKENELHSNDNINSVNSIYQSNDTINQTSENTNPVNDHINQAKISNNDFLINEDQYWEQIISYQEENIGGSLNSNETNDAANLFK